MPDSQVKSDQSASVEICRECQDPATQGLGPGTYWFAPNDLWNAVNGGPNGFLCPECFTDLAALQGIAVGWRAGVVGEVEDIDELRTENERLRVFLGTDVLDMIVGINQAGFDSTRQQAAQAAVSRIDAFLLDLPRASDEEGRSPGIEQISDINWPPEQDEEETHG